MYIFFIERKIVLPGNGVGVGVLTVFGVVDNDDDVDDNDDEIILFGVEL